MTSRDFDFQRAEAIAGYRFEDRTLLQQALQSALRDKVAATDEVIEHDGNRRLAKLGFSLIDLVLVEKWFSQGLNHSPSFLWLYLAVAMVVNWGQSTSMRFRRRS